MRKFLAKSMIMLCAITSLLLLKSCSDDGIEVIHATGVTITPNTLSLVVGASETVKAVITPIDVTNKGITWRSNNREVALVNATGTITAFKEGEAKIIATTDDGAKVGECTVTVYEQVIPVVGITIVPKTLTLTENEDKGTLTTSFSPSNTTERDLIWSSSDVKIATVDESGVVTPLKKGETTITVTVKDKEISNTCVVTVVPKTVYLSGVKLDYGTLKFSESGAPKTLKATFIPENTTNQNVTWSSSDEAVATIDEAGVVTPLKIGTATITVTTEERLKKATCIVEVVAPTAVGMGGNSYVTEDQSGANIDHNKGLTNWRSKKSVISTYFYLHKAGTFELALQAKGNSSVNVKCGDKTIKVNIASDNFAKVNVGKFTTTDPGYVRVDLQGVESATNNFGEVESILVVADGEMSYVHDFENYWGRRGPSVHMKYTLPKENVEWFYNEVTVPKEGETMNSYYMAAGFGEGYFGMQYNSATERRVLFSVWSPFDTEDPDLIPEEDRIKLMKTGRDVHIGEFGNEGSGGQSYLRYNWTAGNTYKFLMQVHPDGKGNTVYTAYFFATDDNEWRLIASFLRPKTDTWYTNAHSFLENFSPNQGYLSRKVALSNQWSYGESAKWVRVTSGTFTHDATASAGVRLDYQGGLLENGSFYLKMGGFFNELTKGYTTFESTAKGTEPDVDFEYLETIK